MMGREVLMCRFLPPGFLLLMNSLKAYKTGLPGQPMKHSRVNVMTFLVVLSELGLKLALGEKKEKLLSYYEKSFWNIFLMIKKKYAKKVDESSAETDEVVPFYLVKFQMILLTSVLWSWQGFGCV